MNLGAQFIASDVVKFRVWAPYLASLHLQLENRPPMPMQKDDKGYFQIEVKDVKEGMLYSYYLPNGLIIHDPVSRFLPKGPFGPTEILKPDFPWTDTKWKAPKEHFIFYECHVGTFTLEGTFEAIIKKLPYLKTLGINCLFFLPISQFSGKFNWGYNWSNAFAPFNGYGTPVQFKTLINACHEMGIAVCLDVVYNHLGTEGCFLNEFGPYSTDFYRTPWGSAINYDGPDSEEVRHFFLENATYWVEEFHIDALRIDATHAMFDFSSKPFLEVLCHQLRDKAYIIVENNLNDSRLIRDEEKGGFGAAAFLNDDFHHALHSALTHEKRDYYLDFSGSLEDLKTILTNRVLYDGTRYSPFRKLTYGRDFREISSDKLIIFLQNHDQIGNRSTGDRISLPFSVQKMTAVLIILSPAHPLIFMGQEYGEEAPFTYFTEIDPNTTKAPVLKGSKVEQNAKEAPQSTGYEGFVKAKLRWKINEPLLSLYQTLIQFRKSQSDFKIVKVHGDTNWLGIEYEENIFIFCAFAPGEFKLPFPVKILLSTEEQRFGGNERITIKNQTLSTDCPVGILFQRC